MKPNNLWNKAKQISLQISDDISGGFDVGFDSRISEETKTELRNFMSWVEKNFLMHVTLWVDFEYKHYLVGRDGKRAGFLFYWADFTSYPMFCNSEDIPQIRIPVRTERSTMEEILASFIEAISCYFAWICNDMDGFVPDDGEVEEILQAYLKTKSQGL